MKYVVDNSSWIVSCIIMYEEIINQNYVYAATGVGIVFFTLKMIVKVSYGIQIWQIFVSSLQVVNDIAHSPNVFHIIHGVGYF